MSIEFTPQQNEDKARTNLSAGEDPGVKKQHDKQAKKNGNTFETIARQWVAANIRWTEEHTAKVLRSLELHAFSFVGNTPITDLKAADLPVPLRVAEKKGYGDAIMRADDPALCPGRIFCIRLINASVSCA
ncbi:phage integrase central domain-containing protein [Martelella alba]|uniref:phage integrase central domain-containing protein n=1 Tax=Martelella alba TaxID=2590451 RepID=UPI001E40C9F9|nr:hypothetical protein [Martelella alba]